jgi:succinate-semialdehyde dehydrogenase / glutarate-semialdehyde dehydrogenase
MATQTIIDPAARAYRTLNPATGEVIREFQTLDDTEARARLDRAHAAYLGWRETTVAERVRLFGRFAELAEANAADMAMLTTLEMGKPLAESYAQAVHGIDYFKPAWTGGIPGVSISSRNERRIEFCGC